MVVVGLECSCRNPRVHSGIRTKNLLSRAKHLLCAGGLLYFEPSPLTALPATLPNMAHPPSHAEGVADYLLACVGLVDTNILTYGLLGSLSVHLVLSVLTNPYYGSHAVLLFGSAALAGAGVYSFFAEPAPYTLPLTAEGGPTGRILSNIMLVYQLFNVAVTFQVKELRSVAMMMHHVVVILLAVASMRPFALGYAAYFMGVVELSSVALTVRDVIDHYALVDLGGAASPGPRLAVTKSVFEGLFVLTFFATRVFGWAFMSYHFYLHCAQLVREDVGPGATMAAALFILSNAFLSVLQVRTYVRTCALITLLFACFACDVFVLLVSTDVAWSLTARTPLVAGPLPALLFVVGARVACAWSDVSLPQVQWSFQIMAAVGAALSPPTPPPPPTAAGADFTKKKKKKHSE